MRECTATTHSLQLPAECSRVSLLNVAHWRAPAPCIQNGQALSKCLVMSNNKWQLSQATQLWVDVLPRVLLNLTAQLAINILFWMKEGTRKIQRSSSIQVYTGLNTSPSVTAMQGAHPPGFLLQVSFLLSPATKINKTGANGVMGSWESRAHSFYLWGRMCSAKESRSEGSEGAGWPDKPRSQASHPWRPSQNSLCPAHTLPAIFSFHAVNINLAVGVFSTIVSLGLSVLYFHLHLVCHGGDDFVSLPWNNAEKNIEIDKNFKHIISKRRRQINESHLKCGFSFKWMYSLSWNSHSRFQSS